MSLVLGMRKSDWSMLQKMIGVGMLMLFACLAMFSQTYTTNLSLAKPPSGMLNWAALMNGNMDTIDSFAGSVQLKILTGSGSPALLCSSTQNPGAYYIDNVAWAPYYCDGVSAWHSLGSSFSYPGAGLAVSTGSAWGTSKTSPSGTVVGTSDTQTLTNKTIDGVTPTVFSYIDPSSSIQTQLDGKWPTPTYANVVTLFDSGSCSGYLKSDGTCDSGGSGTVSAGTAGQLAGYAANGTTVSGMTNQCPFVTDAPYNAACDGSTDDSAAIQAAMDANGCVQLPVSNGTIGLQQCNVTHITQDNAYLHIEGNNSLLQGTASTGAMFTQNLGYAGQYQTSISNLLMDLSATTGAPDELIISAGSADLENVTDLNDSASDYYSLVSQNESLTLSNVNLSSRISVAGGVSDDQYVYASNSKLQNVTVGSHGRVQLDNTVIIGSTWASPTSLNGSGSLSSMTGVPDSGCFNDIVTGASTCWGASAGGLQTCDASTVPNHASALCLMTLDTTDLNQFDGSSTTAIQVIGPPGAGRMLVINPTLSEINFISGSVPYARNANLESAIGSENSFQQNIAFTVSGYNYLAVNLPISSSIYDTSDSLLNSPLLVFTDQVLSGTNAIGTSHLLTGGATDGVNTSQITSGNAGVLYQVGDDVTLDCGAVFQIDTVDGVTGAVLTYEEIFSGAGGGCMVGNGQATSGSDTGSGLELDVLTIGAVYRVDDQLADENCSALAAAHVTSIDANGNMTGYAIDSPGGGCTTGPDAWDESGLGLGSGATFNIDTIIANGNGTMNLSIPYTVVPAQ